MEKQENPEDVERGGYFTQQSGQLITNKKDIKTIVAIILIILAIIINVIMGVWFNHKLNRMNSNLYKEINNSAQTSSVDTESKKFNFGPLLVEQPNYDATTQYLFYSNSVLQEEDNETKDDDGVVLTNYAQEWVHNPVTIAQYGLEQYSNYIETSNQEYYEKAKIQADYLLKIQNQENGKFYYNYDFKVGGTNQTMKAPWSSAMAQGQVISLFARMYYVSKDKAYLEAAQLAMKPLTIDVEDEGLRADFF